MPEISETDAGRTPSNTAHYGIPLTLMMALYFLIGFVSAMNNVLVPYFMDVFKLSNVLALLVQFCFFGAYCLTAIPSGWIVDKIGYQRGMAVGLTAMGGGLLIFVPASLLLMYPLFLLALFVAGSGAALVVVAVNPYLAMLGSPETAASRLNLAAGFSAIASMIAPKLGGTLIFLAAGTGAITLAASVRMPYLVIAGVALGMAALTYLLTFPHLSGQQDASPEAATERSAWQFRNLRLGAVAVFLYSGAEIGISSVLINYLAQPSMGGMSHAAASLYVSLYWGASMVGGFIGFVVLRKIRAHRALAVAAALACISTMTAIVWHGPIALWAIVSCGLFNSVIWPCIFTVAVEGLGKFTNQGSGILLTTVVGGAVLPVIQGFVADSFGYQNSYIVVIGAYAFVLYYAVQGRRFRKSTHTAKCELAASDGA